MHSRHGRLLAMLALLLVAACSREPQSTTPVDADAADLLLRNARIYTAGAGHRIAEAMAVREGRIVFVGSDADAQRYAGAKTEVRDLGGQMVMPGIHDMHIHATGTVEPAMCDMNSEAMSLQRMVPFLRDCIDRYGIADREWLLVLQWPFARGNEPSRELPTLRAALDAVSRTRPIMLLGDDGHHAAANSAALALARNAGGQQVGLSRATIAADFADWRELIAVDAAGEPSGGLNEAARLLVRPNILEDMMGLGSSPEALMPRVAARLASSGITSIQDPWVTPRLLELYDWLAKSGGMNFRLRTALFNQPPGVTHQETVADIPAYVRELEELRRRFGSTPQIQVNAVKLFVDGVLEGNPRADPPTLPVAATLNGFRQPIFAVDPQSGELSIGGYVDTQGEACTAYRADRGAYQSAGAGEAFRSTNGFLPAQCEQRAGVLEHDEAYVREYVRQMTGAGFHVHLHAIADRAVRVAADALEASKDAAVAKGLTQSLAHVQLAHPDDQRRIGKLGAFVAFTYVWILPQREYEMTVIPFIDEVRGDADLYNPDHYYMRNVYPVKSMQDAGAIPVFGSDAPVESRDPMPFVSMAAALTREADGVVMNAAERIGIEDAIAAFTINGARLMGDDADLGSLEAGKIADFIVLDRDIVDLARSGRAAEIAATRVQQTWFEGRLVYEAR